MFLFSCAFAPFATLDRITEAGQLHTEHLLVLNHVFLILLDFLFVPLELSPHFSEFIVNILIGLNVLFNTHHQVLHRVQVLFLRHDQVPHIRHTVPILYVEKVESIHNFFVLVRNNRRLQNVQVKELGLL